MCIRDSCCQAERERDSGHVCRLGRGSGFCCAIPDPAEGCGGWAFCLDLHSVDGGCLLVPAALAERPRFRNF